MKKINLFLLLVFLSHSLFALATWNPWPGEWVFYIGDNIHYFDFDRNGHVETENGEIYDYDWDMENLYIYNYQGSDYIFKVELYDNNLRFNAEEINKGLIIKGHTNK